MHSLRRRAGFVAAVLGTTLLLLLTGTVAHPEPAFAATSGSVSKPYSASWTFRSTSLNRCVHYSVSGSLSGSWRYAYTNGDTNTVAWSSLKLNNPTISATGWAITSTGCDSSRTWSMKADLSQGWYQYTCKLSVSVSAGFPWSVSASPAYTCGSGQVGHRTSTEGPATGTVHQYNSGSPIHFSSTLATRSSGGVAFKGVISVRAHTSSSSDSVTHSVNASLNF